MSTEKGEQCIYLYLIIVIISNNNSKKERKYETIIKLLIKIKLFTSAWSSVVKYESRFIVSPTVLDSSKYLLIASLMDLLNSAGASSEHAQ